MKKLGLLFAAVLMISLSSCGGDNAEKAKDAAKDAVEATKDAAKDAVEATKDAAKDAAEATKDAAKDAVEATKDAVKEVAGKVDGKTLFMENGCVACHNADKKTVGPAVKTIGAAYAAKKEDLKKFLKGEGKAIVDPAQFAVMQPNLNTTKKMNDDQLGALADYFINMK